MAVRGATAEFARAAHHWGLGRYSAVDGDLRPGDVAALVGEQECHQLRNLLRRPVAVHWHLLHSLVALLGRAERDHVGIDWTEMTRCGRSRPTSTSRR